MKKVIALLLVLLLGFSVLVGSGAEAGFAYEHDPRDNPNAMRDIVENPDAVYGFSPNPDSTRLGEYADAIDWTDPDQVAEARALRQAYHDSLSELYRMIEDMLHEGKDVETIARAVSQRRNELRLEAEADDPEALVLTKQSNLETYGDETGPSADFLYEKYGSWQTVLEKALGTNAGMDACLGFYDAYYDMYDIAAEAEADGPEADSDDDPFSLWSPDAPALTALVGYVEAVTDPDSPDFIPEADRIATFDMDGTLMAELAPTYLEVMLLTERILRDPTWEPDDEMLEFGRMTRDCALDKSFPDDYDYEFSYHQARAFAGMTLPEYNDFVTRFLVHEADGFEGMTYADAYYLPMVEVVDYLQDNGFKCYVVSGSDRFIVRAFIEGVFDIPAERVIGSDTALAARDQGDTDGIEYVFTGEDELVRTDKLIIKDLKTNKVAQIAQEIGRQPVLSFGNSSGDVSMNNYALLNNRYRSAAFMVVADDDARDYGNPDNHDPLFEKWQGMGYNAISMRDDWTTIYGEEARKTGEFRWLAEYADSETELLSEYWTEGSEAAKDLNDYLLSVTNAASPDYIPVEDRIAVFDLDGTLMCETDPFCFEYMVFTDYALDHADELPEEVLAVAQEIADATGSAKPSGMSTRQAAAAAIAYKGMTMTELAAVVEDFKASEAWGFTGMTRGEAWFRPMLELVDALQKNDFAVYIVTATERNIVRQVIAGTLDIPPSHVIGTEYGYVATNQGDAADADYTFQSGDQIVFDGSYYGENAKTSKVDAIVREIGQQPVLAFGNSSGDLAMEVYTVSDNPYRSAAYMVLADDDMREWGDPEGAAEKTASYREMGIGTISMRDDFKTIYGSGVTKAVF